MRFRRDLEAVSAPFTFILAGILVVSTAGVVLLASEETGRDTDSQQEVQQRADAEALLAMFVERPGMGWESGADSVSQIGLLEQNKSGIDGSKMGKMKGAMYAADGSNGLLDYDETLQLLGLDPDGTAQIHLRVSPVGLQTVLTADLSGIRTAYLADWDHLDDYDVPLSTDPAMVADARAQIDADIGLLTSEERSAIDALGLGFDNLVHIGASDPDIDVLGLPLQTVVADTGLLDGDVYPDIKTYVDATLPGRIGEYEVLIVGSTVEHAALTSAVTKQAIADWVLAGGTLIIFGSELQNFQWLQPLFEVGTTTVNGGSYAPDVDHPLLREPFALDWTSYDNFGLGWDLKDKGANANYDDFQHIIVEDGEDVLAVSLDGAFGDGRVFLSTFRPEDIADDISLAEASNFINNVVVYADRSHLYLDYGPAPPTDVPVSAASRTSYIWDGDLGQVPVRVTILVWGT